MSTPTDAEREAEQLRRKGDRCLTCGGHVTTTHEEVDCCGPPYTCTDSLDRYECDDCHRYDDSWGLW